MNMLSCAWCEQCGAPTRKIEEVDEIDVVEELETPRSRRLGGARTICGRCRRRTRRARAPGSAIF